jgi:DNA adenine methylase
MEPFCPWPGSKTRCAKAIISEFPTEFGTYYEPFLGSGAVFFAMANRTTYRDFKAARLSDINAKLINCWRAVKERPEHLKNMLLHCLERNSAEFYTQMRGQMDNPSVFLYVMRAAFSGLYRENLKGRFNVPWRSTDFIVGNKLISYGTDRVDKCSIFMNGEKPVDIYVADWSIAVQDVKAGDLVYLDPPYLPYNDAGFVNYVAGGFNEGDHVLLRTTARLLSERGAYVFLSNSDVPASRRLYGEPYKLINVSNSIKSTATTKGTRAEGLWIWKPKQA